MAQACARFRRRRVEAPRSVRVGTAADIYECVEDTAELLDAFTGFGGGGGHAASCRRGVLGVRGLERWCGAKVVKCGSNLCKRARPLAAAAQPPPVAPPVQLLQAPVLAAAAPAAGVGAASRGSAATTPRAASRSR